jgi:hypothetical protein
MGVVMGVIVGMLGFADAMLEPRHRDPVDAHVTVHPDVS